MDFDQYFKARSDLAAHVLLDATPTGPLIADWRFQSAGLACIAGSAAMQLWASVSLVDAGYFARTTTFLDFVLLAGVWLLSIALAGNIQVARTAISSRETTKEKTLRQLLIVDGALARRLADRAE